MSKSSDEITNREKWKSLILEQQASGIGIQAFCDLKNLTPSTFYYHRSRIFSVPKAAKTFVRAKLPVPVKVPPQMTATLYLDKFSLELNGDLTATYLSELCRKLS